MLAENIGVKSIDVVDGRLQIRFHGSPPVEPRRVIELLSSERGSLSPSGMLQLPAPPTSDERIECAASVLRRIIELPVS